MKSPDTNVLFDFPHANLKRFCTFIGFLRFLCDKTTCEACEKLLYRCVLLESEIRHQILKRLLYLYLKITEAGSV